MLEFEEFFAASYRRTLHAVSLAIGDPHRAEDVTQEAFARAFRRWSKVGRMDRPGAWVYVVALNADRRVRRAVRREGDLPPRTEPDDEIDAVLDAITVRALLELLPSRQRAAVVLRYLADLSVAETASALGCAEGTVRSSVHAALTRLRADWHEETIDGP